MLICLLVNPPFPSLIVYFVLPILSLLHSFVKSPLCPPLFSPSLDTSSYACSSMFLSGSFSLPLLFFLCFSLSLGFALPRSFRSARAKSRDRSLQNGSTCDRSSVPIISLVRELRNLARSYVGCRIICACCTHLGHSCKTNIL